MGIRTRGGVVGMTLFGILALAIGLFLLYRAIYLAPAETSQLVATASPSGTLTALQATESANSKIYVSETLGISFAYQKLPLEDGTLVAVKELGNKVVVYFDYLNRQDEKPETEGQYLAVFPKQPADTLEAAIKQKFLQGYTEKSCFARTADRPSDMTNPTYVFATIAYPIKNTGNEPWWVNGTLCEPEHSEANGIRYFFMDTKHSNRFGFVSIGQYLIPSGDGAKPWQDTIQFQ